MTNGEQKTDLETRVTTLEERVNGPAIDLTGKSEEEIQSLRARGLVPFKSSANPLRDGMDLMNKIQNASNLPPLTPKEALEMFSEEGEDPVLCYFPQRVRLRHNESFRVVDYPLGWWLIPECWGDLVRSNYYGCVVAPPALMEQVFAGWLLTRTVTAEP